MNRWIFSLLLLPAIAFPLTADEIIKKVDKNQVFETQKASATMIIDRDGKKLTKKMIMYGMKEGDKFFVEFTNPEDKGVKYLKINKELWIYFPDADDIMKISGHMLRQGMMGSDISYEDMLSDDDYHSKYSSRLIGETNVSGIACYDIELTAKVTDVTYYKERLLIDKEKMVAIELDLYAKSGRLLKKMTQTDIQIFNGRYYPTRLTIRDMKRENSLTTVVLSDVEFDIPLSESIFTRKNLKK